MESWNVFACRFQSFNSISIKRQFYFHGNFYQYPILCHILSFSLLLVVESTRIFLRQCFHSWCWYESEIGFTSFSLLCGLALFFQKILCTEYDINERNSKCPSNSILCDGLLLPKIRFHCKYMDEIVDGVCFTVFCFGVDSSSFNQLKRCFLISRGKGLLNSKTSSLRKQVHNIFFVVAKNRPGSSSGLNHDWSTIYENKRCQKTYTISNLIHRKYLLSLFFFFFRILSIFGSTRKSWSLTVASEWIDAEIEHTLMLFYLQSWWDQQWLFQLRWIGRSVYEIR